MSGFRSNRAKAYLSGRLLFPLLFALAAEACAPVHAWARTAGVTATTGAPVEQYTRRIWRVQDGLPEDTVQAIQQSPDGYLWIGTTGGLVRFDGSHFHLYDHATTPALADDSVFCVLSARDGSLWIGSDGGGLVHFKGGVFRAYSQADGLTNSFVRSLFEMTRAASGSALTTASSR
jgi:hypothetical protein